MEEEKDPSPDYIKKFNYGYTLSKLEPELLSKLLSGDNEKSEALKAMKAGQKQYALEQHLLQMKAAKEKQETKGRER